MQVILLSDVPKIGRKFEVKNVSDGYATNFLFPRKLAEKATPERLARVEERSKQLETQREVNLALLQKNLAALKSSHVHLAARANEQGHLYEGIHQEVIAEALKAQHRIDLDPNFLKLEHPLKSVGEHVVEVHAHGHRGHVTVVITPEA